MAYTKKDWSYKDEISPERLNDIENGIEEVSNQTDKNTDLIDSFSDKEYFSLSGGTYIASNADLNDCFDPGNWYCNSNSRVATLSNCPTTVAFILKVWEPLGNANSGYSCQMLLDYNAYIYLRYYRSGGWGSWRQISTTAVSTSSVGDPVVMSDEDNQD